MRYLEIKTLLEYDRNKTLNRLSVAVARAATNDPTAKDQTAEQLFDQFEQADPTVNKQYVQWLADRYSKGQFQLNQLPSVTQALTQFDQYKPQFAIKDINQYKQVNDLIQATNNIEVKPTGKQQKNTERDQAYSETKVIYSGPEGILASPQTEFASCWLGRNTDFCTARTKADNQFAAYNKDGALYVWMPKNQGPGAKIQIFLPDQGATRPIEINRSDNTPLLGDDFAPYAKIPAIRKLLRTYAENISQSKNADDRDNAFSIFVDYLIEQPNQASIAHMKRDPGLAMQYAINIAKKPMPELEDKILEVVSYAIEYAKAFYPNGWQPLETEILNQLKHSSNYSSSYGEDTSAYYAYEYATNVLKKAWPAAEPYFLESGDKNTVTSYAEKFYPNGWPQLAASILNGYVQSAFNKGAKIQHIIYYANKINKGNWPAAEKVLLTDINTDASILVLYTTAVKKAPWPAAEKRMLSAEMQEEDQNLEWSLVEYAKKVLGRPWPAAEPIIRKNRTDWKDYQRAFELQPTQAYADGQAVSVISGPFEGFDGTVVDAEDDDKIMIKVEIFGRAMTVSLSADQLRAAETPQS